MLECVINSDLNVLKFVVDSGFDMPKFVVNSRLDVLEFVVDSGPDVSVLAWVPTQKLCFVVSTFLL